MSFMKVQLLSVRGLITVPGIIALAIWLLAVPLLWVDHALHAQANALFGPLALMPYATATTVLQTVASAAITTLSLVYSIVLVVFTLAAGNIAPRLLRRFTGDRVNQVTAGILGGAFLLSLTVLHQTSEDFVPVISVGFVMLLAALSVLQLIFFVHSVSQSVTIDEEIAAISGQLENRIETMAKNTYGAGEFDIEEPVTVIAADDSGYVGRIDMDGLLEIACEHDITIRLLRKSGEFVLEGQQVAQVAPQKKGKELERIVRLLFDRVVLMPSRGAVDDIEYSVNLLVEIALRALSPGVNDTFTAIASADRLSAALRLPARDGLHQPRTREGTGRTRVIVPGPGFEELLNAAFHPIRQAASANFLMIQHLADALGRLHEVGNQEAKTLIETHGRLLLATCREANPLAEDYAFIEQRLGFARSGELDERGQDTRDGDEGRQVGT